MNGWAKFYARNLLMPRSIPYAVARLSQITEMVGTGGKSHNKKTEDYIIRIKPKLKPATMDELKEAQNDMADKLLSTGL